MNENNASKKRRVASIFIDESGAKNTAGGLFVVGFMKTYQPSLLWRSVRDIRQRHREYGEIKFASINGKNIRFYFDLVEELANSPHIARVGGSVYDARDGFDAGVETWEEQARMARRLIVGNTSRDEEIICFLDLVQTPRGTTVAERVKGQANARLEGAPLIEAYDVESTSHDLVQLADLVAGAINYERTRSEEQRSETNRNPKYRVMSRLRRALELDSFGDVREGKVNILTMLGSDMLPGFEDAV